MVPLLPAALLVDALGGLWWLTRNDQAEYAAFKRLTATADRQRRYRLWVLKSFLLFFGASVVSLAILGRLGAIASLPGEFGRVSQLARAAVPFDKLSPGFLGGVVGGMLVAGLAAGFLMARRRSPEPRTVALGDIQALLPRNAAETAHTALLSLNAGVSEELFFRLLLPLLLTLITGSVPVAFVGAVIVFGLAHAYQGWVGVLATTVVGAVFAGLYLSTGELWIVMAAHVVLDLLGLVVRPTLARLARRA